ncbi:hypothetical protein OB955_13260 [Halobacteria archaeon AArc-m2/3/4]|uniref:Uncharacterized protein n=1 Tax=Natronoglomus mannanivorans TaxID=2979990 RepID=A0ABT2QFJ4_9EURY|nr:hypothetical protein [Halobacteria archaeon AArc-m2/3/4]
MPDDHHDLDHGLDPDPDPERPPTAHVLEALEVKRNAAIGLGTGVAFAVILFVLFVVPGPTRAEPIYYVGLAFVAAVTIGGSIAVLLTIRSAVKLSRELEDADENDAESTKTR